MYTFLAVALAIFFDRLIGEPPAYRPLRGFSKIAITIEELWHKPASIAAIENKEVYADTGKEISPQAKQIINTVDRIKGVFAVVFLICPFLAIATYIDKGKFGWLNFVFNVVILYLALGAHSLKQHAIDVEHALEQKDMELAKKNVSLLVTRDTQNMSEQNIISGCIEAVLQSGDDVIVGPIFWFVILGAPGVVLYRLAKTLDALWGYKNTRYMYFGWAAARLDDVLNFIPARLTALSYIALGNIKTAWECFTQQSKNWFSPNAGPVLAAGAGALEIEIGGNAYYQGKLKERPMLGAGKTPEVADILRACDLVERSMIFWLAVVLILSINHL